MCRFLTDLKFYLFLVPNLENDKKKLIALIQDCKSYLYQIDKELNCNKRTTKDDEIWISE